MSDAERNNQMNASTHQRTYYWFMYIGTIILQTGTGEQKTSTWNMKVNSIPKLKNIDYLNVLELESKSVFVQGFLCLY